jgi:hypothetical protein
LALGDAGQTSGSEAPSLSPSQRGALLSIRDELWASLVGPTPADISSYAQLESLIISGKSADPHSESPPMLEGILQTVSKWARGLTFSGAEDSPDTSRTHAAPFMRAYLHMDAAYSWLTKGALPVASFTSSAPLDSHSVLSSSWIDR